MMQSPFTFNFSPQQGQQQSASALQQILGARKQQAAMPMQTPDVQQTPPMQPMNTKAPMDFMQLAGTLGYKPDPNADPLQQQSGAIGHIVKTIGSFF